MPTNDDMRLAIGLMSGTSLDGVDAALIHTDGNVISTFGHALTLEYPKTLRQKLRVLVNEHRNDVAVEREMTAFHGLVVEKLLQEASVSTEEVDVIGFHGQTILHAPERGVSIQIGDGAYLATLTGVDVVNDFRSADIRAGGQGAPLVPLYQLAVVQDRPKPMAIVNIGGVSNITYIGADEASIIAFDTGPGNALIDDWMLKHTGVPFDADGKSALSGVVDNTILNTYLEDPFFLQKPPKSLDRNHFNLPLSNHITIESGAATLTAFTAKAIASAQLFLPEKPLAWYITGGGRLNPALMNALERELHGSTVDSVGVIELDGDALEAQAFAFLAVRSLFGYALSIPSTTGAKERVTGGVLHKAKQVPEFTVQKPLCA